MINKINDMVWIQNVPVLLYEMQKDDAIVGAMEAALSVTDHNITYEKIMSLLPDSYICRYFKPKDKWSGGYILEELKEEIEFISKGTGCNFKIIEGDDKRDIFRNSIVTSINKGYPVLFLDRGLNLAVIYGYRDNGNILLTRCYIDPCAMEPDFDTTIFTPIKDMVPFFVFMDNFVTPLPRESAVIDALKNVDVKWRGKKREVINNYNENGTILYGIAAYQEWISDLQSVKNILPEKINQIKFTSWWNSICIRNKRNTLVSFFRNLASDPLKDEDDLQYDELAKVYMQEVRLLKPICDREAWKYEYTIEEWDKYREEDIEIIKQLLENEKKAYQIISVINSRNN